MKKKEPTQEELEHKLKAELAHATSTSAQSLSVAHNSVEFLLDSCIRFMYYREMDALKPHYELAVAHSSIYKTSLIGVCYPDPGESKKRVK